MALGRHLVAELKLEPGADTLGRWMAHHLAELIVRARRTNDPAGRAAAQDRAVETILRIWDHRAASDRINPFSELSPVLTVLRTISEESPPWVYLPVGTAGRAGRRTYDLLRRLTICLSLLELHHVEPLRKGLTRARRTVKHQSNQERELLAHLSLWLDTLPPTTISSKCTAPKKANPPEFSTITRQIVGEIRTVLDELDNELQERDSNAGQSRPKA